MENVSGCTYMVLYERNKIGRKLPPNIPTFRDVNIQSSKWLMILKYDKENAWYMKA